jgi:hypothetical protein
MSPVTDSLEVGERGVVDVLALRLITPGIAHDHETFAVREGHRLEQHRVHEREHRGVDANPQRQGGNDGE